jgi:DNA end-binding protein Ku
MGKLAFRGTGETLAVVHAQGDVLVLHRLHWPDELRASDDAAPRGEVDLSDEELQAALDYIGAVGDIDMTQMRDDYSDAVRALLEAKAAADKAPPPAPKEPQREEAGVTDLMTALQRATEQARADRGEDAEVHPIGGRKPAKKTAKRTAKKTSAKKSAAKKTTRKRAG